MMILVAAALVLGAAGANAQGSAPQYPSCDLKAQRALRGELGGSIKDPRQAHVSMRANILQADLGNARKARSISQAMTDRLYRRVETVRASADGYTRKQGFLSAGEVASFDRELDAIATQACGRTAPPRSQAGLSSDSDYLQQRATTLNGRIDDAVRRHRLTPGEARRLHLDVRRIQTEAGHLQAVNGTISRQDADRMNQRLTDVERTLTHQA